MPLSASDDDLRAAAKEAAAAAAGIVALSVIVGYRGRVAMLASHCKSWGVDPPKFSGNQDEGGPAIRRACCSRWWPRRLRRAHGRMAEGAAIRAGVVRRGLWPYVSQDGLERREGQRARNARALEKAVLESRQSGEALPLADVVAGSLANPEVKRSELMVRIRGCDAIAHDDSLACEFWTLTAPSRFHAHRTIAGKGKKTEPNPHYDGSSPKAGQAYIRSVWARARAAWARVGLSVYGLRTAEPHHEGCPHWHLIAYGRPEQLRAAGEILRRYALAESPEEAGAAKHRFVVLCAKAGRYGAAYAAKYISKNINGEGMGRAGDGEAGRKVADSAKRVDAWAAAWGIRQFQFFGCPAVSLWRVLRRLSDQDVPRGSLLDRARSAADDSDFAEFWRCAVRGGFKLLYRAADCLTQYGDAAAARVAGIEAEGRRVFLAVKEWVIHWGGFKKPGALDFVFPRSGVNNCTRSGLSGWADDLVGAIFSIGCGNDRLRL